jgi:hypothetical protein
MSNDKKTYGKIDWVLLVFLLLFTNQAILSVKIFGLLLIYALRPNFKFGWKEGRMPKFYIYIIGLALLNLVLFIREFTPAYFAAFFVGNLFWIFSFLGYHQCRLSIEQYGHEGIFRTMKVFIVLNFLVCIIQLVNIMMITKTFNPYVGLDFPYGVSTGDNIYGTFMQNSYYNMMVSAMLAVYFMYKRSFIYTLLAATCLILVFGNVGTILFVVVLFALLFTGIFNALYNNPERKAYFYKILGNISPRGNYGLYIPALFLFVYFMYASISPDNTKYIEEKVKDKVYAFNTDKQDSYVSLISNQKPDPRAYDLSFTNDYARIRQDELDRSRTYSYSEAQNAGAADANVRLQIRKEMTDAYIEKLQGKTLAFIETKQFMKSSPVNFLVGAGTTRFSSLTAQKMSGFDSSRLFMNVLPKYTSPVFEENHMLILESRMKAKSAQYSSANWPDSFYNQLLGEYGFAGILLFLAFYLWHFVSRIRYWSYGFWLVVLIIPFAHLVYMFETLCVMVFFELLMEADIAEGKSKIENERAYT